MTYAVVLEKAANTWSAYVPSLDGVVAVGATRERVLELIAEAIPIHLRGLAEDGIAAPEATETEAVVLVIPAVA